MHDKPVPYEDGALLILPLAGEFDLANSGEFEAALDGADDGKRTIVIDFSQVKYLDSSTLNVIVRRHNKLGTRLRVVVPPLCQARRIFDLSGLSKQLDIVDSIDDLKR